MLNLPYGISDFYKIRSEGYDYVDRTHYIPAVEAFGKHLVFLRPRRFGKSLWLSTLENYYDLAKAAEFERLFGDLAVGQNPTPRRNSYFVLRWDFSLVSPQGEVAEIGQALHAHINARIQAFAQTYQQWLKHPITILPENAIASFESLLAAVHVSPHRLYLLIDEYDNFANEVLMSRVREGSEHYKALLYGEGLLKTVFKAVKGGSSGLGIDRVFTTGVAPIVLSDLSSGYNISESITLLPRFSQLCGFTQAEVSALWTQVADGCDLPAEARVEPLELMRTYYNGYCFNMEVSEPIYNPTLTLYFLKAFQEGRAAPRELLDSNLAMDRGKITYIAGLPNSDPVLASALDDERPPVIEALARSFGVADVIDQPKDERFMVSLLYYFGVLTLDGITEMGELRFRVPNLVIRSLYAEQLRRHVLPPDEQRTASDAARALFHQGELQPLCEFIETTYFRALDNRDYRWANELTVKLAFLTLLFNDRFYIVDSEPAIERSYADLTLLVRPDMRHYALQDALLEFKYLPLSDLGLSGEAAKTTPRADLAALPLVQTRLAEARHKAEGYRATLQCAYHNRLRLHTYVIVALGFERLVWVKL
ncbi:AAA family ATPase [Candidatus Viridilinea mediisalina]|uniref:AAA family ATPase n=1 Tax=Candidatus Viridilinea mediisalina TaxID=2024553 RepID=A0A2A6RH91_9CHLR|nr:AAA family ATPase [Candidatus Viridilinea mediisalina]PDW02248.1 AAA family ATPase [Candidatus Viridilinea mediisalina]